MSEAIVEIIARAIYAADNGIDGDTIGSMLYEDFRIEPKGQPGVDPATECRDATLGVCKTAATAALSALRAAGYAVVAREPSASQTASVCLSYRHDYGLLEDDQKRRVVLQGRHWLEAWVKEFDRHSARAMIAAAEKE